LHFQFFFSVSAREQLEFVGFFGDEEFSVLFRWQKEMGVLLQYFAAISCEFGLNLMVKVED
jgi:hypothetical protein